MTNSKNKKFEVHRFPDTLIFVYYLSVRETVYFPQGESQSKVPAVCLGAMPAGESKGQETMQESKNAG